MKSQITGKILRIYTGNSDRWQGRPLHTAILARAVDEGLSGATVVSGIEGFGSHGHIHTAALLDVSTGLPVIVEIVDTAARIAAFLPVIDEMMTEGAVSIQDCTIIRYSKD
jgi:PII-like signaling protein